jgi:RimJ/RimL family protein N-acetyltransferase
MTGPDLIGEPVARTARTILRPWRLDEADRYFDIHRRAEVARWLGGEPMTDPGEATARLEAVAARLAADPRFGAWAIVPVQTGVPAGSVLLKPLPDGEGEIEIGWHLHPDSWGQGLATEAATAILERGWRQGLEEVWALTHLDNDRSANVCRKIGLRLLGVTRRWYHELGLMFWAGARDGQAPSVAPEGPVPGQTRAG